MSDFHETSSECFASQPLTSVQIWGHFHFSITNYGLKRISRFYMGVYRDFDTHPRHFSHCVRDTTHMDTKFGHNVSNRYYFKVAQYCAFDMTKLLVRCVFLLDIITSSLFACYMLKSMYNSLFFIFWAFLYKKTTEKILISLHPYPFTSHMV